MLGGLVLAAGASSRMGRPKALLDFDGVPAVVRVCTALTEGGCERVVVVLGADADQVEPAVPSGVEVVRHAEWRRGQTTSVQEGLTILRRADAVLVAPVDRPLFTPDDVRALVDAPGPLAVPVHDGARGHPLLVRRPVFDEVLALAADDPLHDVVHRDADRVAEVPVDNPGVLVNVDTVDAYEAARGLDVGWSPAP